MNRLIPNVVGRVMSALSPSSRISCQTRPRSAPRQRERREPSALPTRSRHPLFRSRCPGAAGRTRARAPASSRASQGTRWQVAFRAIGAQSTARDPPTHEPRELRAKANGWRVQRMPDGHPVPARAPSAGVQQGGLPLQEQAASFLRRTRVGTGAAFPRFIKDGVDNSPRRGVLAHEFGRRCCGACGRDEPWRAADAGAGSALCTACGRCLQLRCSR